MWWLLWAAFAAAAVVVALDAGVRRAHAWYWTASLGGERRGRLPPGDMGWPLVGGMWAFLRAFKSGKPDVFIDSFVRRSVTVPPFPSARISRLHFLTFPA